MDLKEQLAATRKEVNQLTFQLRQCDGERMSVIISQRWQWMVDIFADELQLLKKMSRAKCFENAQLQAKLKGSEGEIL